MIEVFEKMKIRWLLAYFTVSIVVDILLRIIMNISFNELEGTFEDLIGFGSNLILVIFMAIYYYKKKGENKVSFEFIKERETKKELILLILFNIIFTIASGYLIQGIIHYIKPQLLKSLLEESPIQSDNIFIGILLACIMAPLVEEFMFRGIIFTRLRFRFNNTAAVLISSLMFGLLHVSLARVHAFIFGITVCLVFKKYNNIFLNIILHSVCNFLSIITDYISFLNFDILTASDSSIKLYILISTVFVLLSSIYLFKFCKNNWNVRESNTGVVELV